MCFRIGSCRLYAPMVPLAPHPCVRWWNTKMMPLKLPRLGLHSLRGGSTHQKPSYPVGARCVWMVGVRQSFNCVVVRGHSLTGQRMAPHTPQESPKVKTKCFRIGSKRLYALMVPLVPHPCVRWWNTKEITLKLTCLGLHSLKGGSPTGCYRPLRRRGYQRTGNGIPPTQRQWRKGDHGSLKPRPPETKGIPQSLLPVG